MAKESYYFSHDYDPTGDPKMQAMLGSFGGMGYGIFWRIVEMLHAESSHRLKLKTYIYEAIAKQMLTTPKQVEELISYCIHTAELFLSDGESIWSNRVFRNIEKRDVISKVRSDAGKNGAIAKQIKAIAKQTSANGQQNEAKERKGKEIKEDVGIYAEVPTTMTNDDFKEFKLRLLKDRMFIDPLMMNRNILNEKELEDWVVRYHVHITGEGKINKDYSEYRKHFKNWICKQDTFNKPSPTTKKMVI